MKVCKNCGEINTNDCDFCCSCGQSSFIFQEEVICTRCGATNDKSFVYCINCGSELVKPVRADVSEVAPPDIPQMHGGEGYTPIPVDLREQLSEVYGGLSSTTPTETAQCPNCGNIVHVHTIFCQKCGAPVYKLHDHRVVRRKICPHCGRPNSLESHFCTYCFCTLANAETQDMQVVHSVKQVGDDMLRQAFLEDEHGKKKICTNCGTLNPPEELFCETCGLKLDAEEQKRYCPNCGAENLSTNTFCTRCQWSFDGTAPDSGEKWVCSNCLNENDSKNSFCVVCGAKRATKGRKK